MTSLFLFYQSVMVSIIFDMVRWVDGANKSYKNHAGWKMYSTLVCEMFYG